MFHRRWFGDAALSVTVAELATALTQAAETIQIFVGCTKGFDDLQVGRP
jgi:hypothetical protein